MVYIYHLDFVFINHQEGERPRNTNDLQQRPNGIIFFCFLFPFVVRKEMEITPKRFHNNSRSFRELESNNVIKFLCIPYKYHFSL